MKKHTKHTKLVKPNIGEFGRNEWAIIGTVCSDIQRISKQIISELKTDFKLAYVDADHQNFNKNESLSKVIINKKKIIDELIKINHLEFSYFKNELILAFISSHSNQKDISHWINYEKKMTTELLNKSNVVQIICGKNKKFSDEIFNFLREKKVLL